jgi:ferrous iron transport protein B
MAVIVFLAPAFFGSAAPLVSWGLVLLSLVVLALTGIVLNRTLFGGRRSAFIMELPLYHLPNWRTIGLSVWQRSLSFIRKAGAVIVVVSVVIWLPPHSPAEAPKRVSSPNWGGGWNRRGVCWGWTGG